VTQLLPRSLLAACRPVFLTLWSCAPHRLAPLVSMLSSSDVHTQELGSVVIHRLSRASPSVALTVAESGGIVPLVLMVTSASSAAQQQAAAALAAVSTVPANRDAVADAGGIDALVPLLSSKVVGTPETAARALAQLARDAADVGDDGGASAEEVSAGDDEEGEEGAVVAEGEAPAEGAASEGAATHGAVADDQTAVVDAGAGVTEHSGARRRQSVQHKPGERRRRMICEAGGVDALIGMVQATPVKGAALRMWQLMATVIGMSKGAIESSMAKEGEAATSDVVGVQEQAAATIADFAHGDRRVQDAVIRAGGVPPLLSLLRIGSATSQENAARALWHLCEATDNQGVVVGAGAITDLVALSKTGSAKAQELAAAVISDLAKGAIVERERAALEKRQRLEREGAPRSLRLPQFRLLVADLWESQGRYGRQRRH
jgi:hypothetical protein